MTHWGLKLQDKESGQRHKKKSIQTYTTDKTSCYIKQWVGVGRQKKMSDSGKMLWRWVGQAVHPECGKRSKAEADSFCWDQLWSREGFPEGSEVKNLPAMQETQLRFRGREDSPGEGNGSPLQYSCLESPMDRGAWWSTALGVTKSENDLAT